MDKYVFELFMLFLIYSFAGWCMEVCISLKLRHKFINRGFLVGPICPIYGFGCVLLQLLLSKYLDNPFGLFCTSIVVCSFLEYMTSYIMEKIFKARWWDYSNIPFNVEGRICLKNSIGFGILGTIVMYFLNPPVLDFFDKLDYNLLRNISIVFFIIVLIDYIISLNTILSLKDALIKYSKDNTEEISKKVREKILALGMLHRRLYNAYPNVRIRNRINNVKQKIKNYKNK